jgi:dihydroorotase (homodimeric type)
VFLDRVLEPLRRRLPGLRVVLEHVTTANGVEYVLGAENMAATLTVHHLILNRNHLLVGGIRPHFYCLPIVKRERHRLALRKAATGGDPRFFLGTDSAPHARDTKEAACGCAGVFTAPVAMGWLARVFEEGDPREGLLAWYREALAPLSAFALRQGTAALRESSGFLAELDRTLDAAERRYVEEVLPSHDGNEGVEAFLERRAASWRDR